LGSDQVAERRRSALNDEPFNRDATCNLRFRSRHGGATSSLLGFLLLPPIHQPLSTHTCGVFIVTTLLACSRSNNQRHLLPYGMKVHIKRWNAVAQWQWDTGSAAADGDEDGDVCGICRIPYEGCCPVCKVPGDDCPLSE
jgi:hypothetical protein